MMLDAVAAVLGGQLLLWRRVLIAKMKLIVTVAPDTDLAEYQAAGYPAIFLPGQ